MFVFVGTSGYLPSADKWLLYIYCIILANTLQERYSLRKQTVKHRYCAHVSMKSPLHLLLIKCLWCSHSGHWLFLYMLSYINNNELKRTKLNQRITLVYLRQYLRHLYTSYMYSFEGQLQYMLRVCIFVYITPAPFCSNNLTLINITINLTQFYQNFGIISKDSDICAVK